jgi:hypothetical protein
MMSRIFFPLDMSPVRPELWMFVRYPAWALLWRALLSLSDLFLVSIV